MGRGVHGLRWLPQLAGGGGPQAHPQLIAIGGLKPAHLKQHFPLLALCRTGLESFLVKLLGAFMEVTMVGRVG